MSFFDIMYDVARPQQMKDLQQIESLYKAVKDSDRRATEKTVKEVRSTLKKSWLEQIEKDLAGRAARLEEAARAKAVWPKENIDGCEKEVFRRFREEHKKGLPKVEMKKTYDAIQVLIYELRQHIRKLEDAIALSAKAPAVLDKMRAEHSKVRDASRQLGDKLKALVKVPVMTSIQADILTQALHCDEIAHNAAEVMAGCGALLKVHAARVKDARERIELTQEQLDTVSASSYWEDLEVLAL